MDYSDLVSVENIFKAWEEFKRGKRKKQDVMMFERNLENNIFGLHQRLKNKTYKHGGYVEFYVNDPKRRHIHKAEVVDRVVHHLLYKYLYDLFDNKFIYDSYSCRVDKGTHKAVRRLEYFSRKLSKNYTQDFWALKLDIKKFFASVEHEIIIGLIKKKVEDEDVLWLISEVLRSFASAQDDSGVEVGVRPLKGIPLGNLTSQIFANIYMNELDQFVKHQLLIKYYIRYADDFLILDTNFDFLLRCFETAEQFLRDSLKLEIHPKKISYRKFSWGVDFCGYVVLPHYTLPRNKTKKRIFKKIKRSTVNNQSLQSYLGYFSHASAFSLKQNLLNNYYFG